MARVAIQLLTMMGALHPPSAACAMALLLEPDKTRSIISSPLIRNFFMGSKPPFYAPQSAQSPTYI
jgi:hypothetical protein